MPRIKLEEMLDGISNYLIERGHAKSKEDIKYEWQNSIEFLGIREGKINTKDKKIEIRISRNFPASRFNVSLNGSYLTENGESLNLRIYKDKEIRIEERGISENLKKLFKIIPSSQTYMWTNFCEGLYKGLSDSTILFLLFKNLEEKNLAAIASVTDYLVLDAGEYVGERLGYRNVDRHLSKHVPIFGILESSEKWTRFLSSKQWNARKKLEDYLFEKYCNRNTEKMRELYLNKVEEINKIIENPNPEAWKDDLINSVILERKTDAKEKKVYDTIKFDNNSNKFLLNEEVKKGFETAIAEIINNPQEFEAKYKPKLAKFYEELERTSTDSIKLGKIMALLFQEKQPRDKNLASLILSLEKIPEENIENCLKKFNREISEKKLRKERGRFSEFIYDFIDVVKKGCMGNGKESEYIQEMDSVLNDIKEKRELNKQDILTFNEFASDYILNKRILIEQNLLNEEQKNAVNAKTKEISEFVQSYSKDKTADFTPMVNEIENYLSLQKKLAKELKGNSEKEYMRLSELENLLNARINSLTRHVNEEEIEKITENSFKFLNRNRVFEGFSLAGLLGMTAASKYTAFANKFGWGGLIAAKSFFDGLVIGETNRITESYFLYSYRKQLEDSNVDPDLAFTEYSSRCLRYYKTGSTIGLAFGLPFTYMGNEDRKWLLSIPFTLALLSAGAVGISHYIFQKQARKKLKENKKP
jgi:hypothetical protein